MKDFPETMYIRRQIEDGGNTCFFVAEESLADHAVLKKTVPVAIYRLFEADQN